MVEATRAEPASGNVSVLASVGRATTSGNQVLERLPSTPFDATNIGKKL
jgi:hypothetical protein